MEEAIDETGAVAVSAADRSEESILPCSLVVSDWHTTLVSCLRHCFQLGKYCDLVIQFCDGDSVKVHRVVLESCCSLARVGKVCEDNPGLVVAYPHITAALLCPLIRFLYTGMITLTSPQLRLARCIQLSLLLDCASKLGISESAPFGPDYEEKDETSPCSPSLQSVPLIDGPALGSDGVTGSSLGIRDEADNIFSSNNLLPVDRGHSNENVFSTDHINDTVCCPAISSEESLVSFRSDVPQSDLQTSVAADISTEVGCENQSENLADNEAAQTTECVTTSVHGANVSFLIDTQSEREFSNGLSKLGELQTLSNSCVTPDHATDARFSKPINSISHAMPFVNPSEMAVSTSNSQTSTPLLSESQFENRLESLQSSLNDNSFSSLNKFDREISALSSSPVALSTSQAPENFCSQGDIFAHGTSVHTSSRPEVESSWAPTSNTNNARVQSACDSAFDALLLGEPEQRRPSAETSSHSLASTAAAGGSCTVDGGVPNILLLPTNSQMLEKANAAARRRRQSQTSNIPRPTRFLLDDAEEVAGDENSFYGAAFKSDCASRFKDSPAQHGGSFLPSLKPSLLSNPRLETLTKSLFKFDTSTANATNTDSCRVSNSQAVDGRSSISCSYTTSGMHAESSSTFYSSSLISPCESSSLCDRIESSTSSSSERKFVCKKSLADLNTPKKKPKVECAKPSHASTPDASADKNASSSHAGQKEARILSTPSSSISQGQQSLFEASKLANVGLEFPGTVLKNSLNCYEIKPRDDLSFEVVPSSVAFVGKSQALPQNHMNESEVNLNNHAKIITEVLKKFPNLIKDRKNVKLKIMKQELDKSLANNSTPSKGLLLNTLAPTRSMEIAKNIAFRCSKCQQLFATHFSLKKHVLNNHEDPTDILQRSGRKLYACWCCSGGTQCFDSNVQLQRHIKEAHRCEQLQCGECGYKGARSIDVAFHMYKAHGTVPHPDYHFPKCKMCSFVGRSSSDLDRHRSSKHSTDSYTCSSCHVSFRSLGALQGHVQAKVCQNKPGASFMCPHCSETFSKSYNLKAHLRSRHKNLKSKRLDLASSNKIGKNVSFVHDGGGHPEKDLRDTTMEYKQDSTCTVPNNLFSYDSKKPPDISEDFQGDNSCVSSSFVVRNDALKSNETYNLNSNSGFIEIIGSCSDVGVSYAPRSLTQSAILDVVPATSSSKVHPSPVLADDAWACLSSDAGTSSVTSPTCISSVMKDPFSE